MAMPYRATIATFQNYAPTGTKTRDEKQPFDHDFSRIEQEVIEYLNSRWSIKPFPKSQETKDRLKITENIYVVAQSVFIAFPRKVYRGHIPISKSARNHVLKRLSAHFDEYDWIQPRVDQVSDLRVVIKIISEDDGEAIVNFYTLNIEAQGDNAAQISYFAEILEDTVRKINKRTNMRGFGPREVSHQYPLFDVDSL